MLVLVLILLILAQLLLNVVAVVAWTRRPAKSRVSLRRPRSLRRRRRTRPLSNPVVISDGSVYDAPEPDDATPSPSPSPSPPDQLDPLDDALFVRSAHVLCNPVFCS